MRTEVLQRSRGFVYPMGFAADTGLTLELAALGRMVCVPKLLMSFRLHDQSLSMDPNDPIHGGRHGRQFDAAARAFVDGLPLGTVERRMLAREVAAWCRRAQRPRRFLWRSGGFRSVYARVQHAWVDAARRIHRV